MAIPAGKSHRPEEKIWSVAELTRRVKSVLENALPMVWVEGEISNFTHHSSGHMYFSLKDERAQIRCVFFRGKNSKLKFRPEAGLKVRLLGDVTVYEPRGDYQLLVDRMIPVGKGELELAFRQLVDKLEKRGWFAAERKKQLPAHPTTVGIITSPTGAAIHDMIRTFQSRMPVEILLYPVRVQGVGAAEEIARAVSRMNEWGEADVLIVGRGGGSLEDLWAFNEEVLAEAIYRSEIPVISGVGHEVDVTISDMVADVRAVTPTAAAEILVPSLANVQADLDRLGDRLVRRIREIFRFWRERLERFAESRALGEPRARLREEAQRLDDLATRIGLALRRVEERFRERIAGLSGKLDALDPLSVLNRGYSICRPASGGNAITDGRNVAKGDLLEVRFRRGSVLARAESIDPGKEPGDEEGGEE